MPRQPANQTPQRRLGDRRQRPRFEIVGQLWGSLELVEPLAVVDLSPGGALLEGPAELPVESVHRLRVEHAAETADVQVRVAHARAIDTVSGSGLHRTGVEFLAVPESASGWLDTVLAENPSQGDDRTADRDADGPESSLRD
jgi:hypothetical protein